MMVKQILKPYVLILTPELFVKNEMYIHFLRLCKIHLYVYINNVCVSKALYFPLFLYAMGSKIYFCNLFSLNIS